ncbi:hypothetical protein EV1_028072 [Malus domestica]
MSWAMNPSPSAAKVAESKGARAAPCFSADVSASNSKYNRTISVQVDEEIKAVISNDLPAKFAALKSPPLTALAFAPSPSVSPALPRSTSTASAIAVSSDSSSSLASPVPSSVDSPRLSSSLILLYSIFSLRLS